MNGPPAELPRTGMVGIGARRGGCTGVACSLAAAIAWIMDTWIDDAARAAALDSTYHWTLIIGGAELLRAVSYTIWPRKETARVKP